MQQSACAFAQADGCVSFFNKFSKADFSWVVPIFAIHENMFQSVTIDLIDSQLIIVEY